MLVSGEHHEEHCFSEDSAAVARRGLELMFAGPSCWFSSITEEPILSINSEPPSRKQAMRYDNEEPHVLAFSCYRRVWLLSNGCEGTLKPRQSRHHAPA